MNIERKLELLNTLAGSGRGFPADAVYIDGEYVMATNGWQLLAFRAAEGEFDGLLTLDEGARRFSDLTKREPVAPGHIRRWLSQEVETRTVDNRDLYSFLRVAEYRHCPYCKGAGVRPIEEPDWEEGPINDPFDIPRIVDLDGAWINCNLLLSMLAYLPMSDRIALSTWPEMAKFRGGEGEARILRLVGDGWTIVQMSVTQPEGNKAEVFPVEPVAVAESAKSN